MLILRKYMSMLGIGSAKIDLQLPKLQYTPGENVSGIFLIEGGTIEQQIKTGSATTTQAESRCDRTTIAYHATR